MLNPIYSAKKNKKNNTNRNMINESFKMNYIFFTDLRYDSCDSFSNPMKCLVSYRIRKSFKNTW